MQVGAPTAPIIPSELNFLLAGGKNACFNSACAWV